MRANKKGEKWKEKGKTTRDWEETLSSLFAFIHSFGGGIESFVFARQASARREFSARLAV